MKQALKSKTIVFNYLMLAIGALHVNIQTIQPLLTTDQFIYVTMGLTLAQTLGAHYLRTITDTALSEK